jgi:hypothetical protein
MYVEENCLWSSILKPLVKGPFLASWLRYKIELPVKLAPAPRAVSSTKF